MLKGKMTHIKELQYQIDQTFIEKQDWDNQKSEFKRRTDEQKADIWEKIKAKLNAELLLKNVQDKLKDALKKEPLNEEHIYNLMEIVPDQK